MGDREVFFLRVTGDLPRLPAAGPRAIINASRQVELFDEELRGEFFHAGVAADIVEVRPIPPNHVTEFVAARLAYKIIAYTQQ